MTDQANENADPRAAVFETVDGVDWKNPPKLANLKQDFSNGKESHDQTVLEVKAWLDNLHGTGSAKPKVPKGNSTLVPKLIRRQAEWRYSALAEAFHTTEDVFDVRPVTWEDRKSAQQNRLVLNNQFNTKIDKVAFIDEYVRTCVDEGTAIVQVGWEFEEIQEPEMQPICSFQVDLSMASLFEQLNQLKDSDPNGYARDVPKELQMAHKETLRIKWPVRPTITGWQEVMVPRIVANHPTLEVCDFRNLTIDPSCKGNLDKAGFVIKSFESSLSILKKDGRYKNLEHINIEGATILGEPDHESENTTNFNFDDKSRQKFVVFEYWGYWDIDGTGRLEPIVAAWVGNVLIRMELNPFPDRKHPFVAAQYLPRRKKVWGEPDGAVIEDNQKILGAVTRGMIDLMAKSANGQTGIRKDALDAVNKRRYQQGLDYEFNGNVQPEQAFYTHKYPEIPASAQFMMELQNFEAESMTGVKSFSSGISGKGLGEVAAGIRGALDAASKRELNILRRIAGGLIKIGRKIIAMNAVFLEEEEVVRITNEEFVHVRRDDLAGNFDLRLTISTAEEDNAKAQELAFMLQTVGPNEDPMVRRMVMADIARLRKMPDLAKRLEEFQPAPDPVQQAELELKQWQIKEVQARIAQLYSGANLNQAKVGTEVAKAANLGSETDLNNLDFVEQESGVTQERELQQLSQQAESNIKLERVKQTGRVPANDDYRSELRSYLKNVR